ncbi:MAG: histidine kinase, partial [Spirochaetaceae bacterium]|nr:histidine kinase [Spirochaetaceae bacterium]
MSPAAGGRAARAREPGKLRIELLALAAVLILIAGLVALTVFVYARLADRLVADTQAAIANRARSVSSSVAAVFSLAADEAMNLMASYASRAELDPSSPADADALRARLGQIQSGLIGCSGAWIVPRGREPLTAAGTPLASPGLRAWWRDYMDESGARRLGTFGNLGIRRSFGFLAKPFRGGTGIGTIVPLVVSYHVGMAPVMTAFFEIDITVILDQLMDELAKGSSLDDYAMEMSFYDDEGILVETTSNLPLVRFPPFGGVPAEPQHLELGSSLGEYLFPGGRSIEASFKDDRLNLLCVGRVPAIEVMKSVRRIATNVLAVGAAAVGAVLVLGFMLLQAFRRARSFEKEQLLARFQALQAKVNPHFLFNTLDSMIGVAEA